jgi:hypothetical protein
MNLNEVALRKMGKLMAAIESEAAVVLEVVDGTNDNPGLEGLRSLEVRWEPVNPAVLERWLADE